MNINMIYAFVLDSMDRKMYCDVIGEEKKRRLM